MRTFVGLSMVAAALALSACGVTTDANGVRTQPARYAGYHHSADGLFHFIVPVSTCNAVDVSGCGGMGDRAEYARLAAAGKLCFSPGVVRGSENAPTGCYRP